MKKTICFCLTLLLALPLTFLAGAFALPGQYRDTFLGELPVKVELLRDAPGKRLILVGGSAVAFGVDSALAEEQLPEYTVVNFGLYAALGTRIMLDLALPELRQGDIVILSPEQDPQPLSLYFDPASYWQAADGRPGLLLDAPRELWPALAAELPYFSMGKWKNLLTGQLPQPSGVYRRDSFDGHGDVDSALCACNIMAGGFDPGTPVRFDEAVISPDFIEYCNAFAAAAEEKGALVWYRFPPMNAAAVEGDVDAYAQWLWERLDFPLIGDPKAAVLEPGWFYDTNFHLNSAGKVVNTRLLVRDVKAMLADPSPTAIRLPAMPEMADTAPWQGDDEDAGYFTGRLVDGKAVLTGLTPEGAGRSALTVPSHWGGCPVEELPSEVFSGNGAVETVVLQPNIRRIADGAFARCSGLKTIQLISADPGRCMVGQGLLDGTAAEILVPAQALGAYRGHYTWAAYAARIHSG